MDSTWTNPALSSQSPAYDMQGDEAEAGCDYTFPNEIALGNHICTHHAPAGGVAAVPTAHGHINHHFDLDLFDVVSTFGSSPGLLLDTTWTSQPITGFENDVPHPNAAVYVQVGLDHYDTHYDPTGQDNLHPLNTLGFANNHPNTYLAPFTTAESSSTSTNVPSPQTVLTTSTSTPTPTAIPNTAAPRIPCTHPACPKSYTRQADMLRHARKHSSSAERFSCEVAGCKYTGSMGFLRMDKLRSHQKNGHGI